MFLLLATSLPALALALCLGTANATDAGALDALRSMSRQPLRPAAQQGILPGGCYVPEYGGGIGTNPAACPAGWCGTPAAADPSLALDCPNGFELEPYRPAGRPMEPYTGRMPAARDLPSMPAYSRPLPERALRRPAIPPAGGMFESGHIAFPTDHLRHDLEYRDSNALGRTRRALDGSPQQRPRDFHILPVSNAASDWFLGDTPSGR